MPHLETARVVGNTAISDRLWWTELEAPRTAAEARPGQFAHVRCGPAESFDPMLRRPLSFSRIDAGTGRVAFLVDAVGRGTAWLVRQPPGAPVNLLAPLGTSFAYQPGARTALMVGGGIGLAPLIALADDAPAAGIAVTLLGGARDAAGLTPREFVGAGIDYAVATDDGSAGHYGRVTELADARLAGAEQLFVCGPTPMLRTMARLSSQRAAAGHDPPAFTSLEARMGCAMGVCYSCVVPTRRGLQRVCHDGPVFPQSDIDWEGPASA